MFCFLDNAAKKQKYIIWEDSKISLNKEKRKRELINIAMENQALMQRIQTKKSFYNTKDWDKSRKTAEKYLTNICEYPPSIVKPGFSTFYEKRNQIRTEVNKKKIVPVISKLAILANQEKRRHLYWYLTKKTKLIFFE